jgi:hypothetical protein
MDGSSGVWRARILAAGSAVAVLIAACGGASSAAGSTNYQKAVAFAQCMRAHGMPRFPDPNSQGVLVSTKANAGDFDGPGSASANKACQHLLPDGGVPTVAQQEKFMASALRFAACMRSHGIAEFPDPGLRGGWSHGELQRLGIDASSPRFKSAQRTCHKIVPPVAP